MNTNYKVSENLGYLMNEFSQATNTALLVSNIQGKEQSDYYNYNPFCQMMRNHPVYSERCRRCDALGAINSLRNHSSISIYRCYNGLVDAAIPIVTQNQISGFILAGQLKVDESENLDRIKTPFSTLTELSDSARNLYYSIKTINSSQLYSKLEILKLMVEKLYHDDNFIKPEFFYVSKNENCSDDKDIYLQNNSENIVTSILEFIKNNLNQDLSLNILAQKNYISPTYLSKLFKKVMGENLHAYIIRVRMNEAKRYLIDTDFSINKIGKKVGYSHPSAFIAAFKKYSDLSPELYRKTYSNEKATEQ